MSYSLSRYYPFGEITVYTRFVIWNHDFFALYKYIIQILLRKIDTQLNYTQQSLIHNLDVLIVEQ